MNPYTTSVWPTPLQLHLLQAALLEEPLKQQAWQQWATKVDFDQIDPASYKLLPLLARNQAQTGGIFEKCKGVYRKTWVENQVQWKRALPLLQELVHKGVDRIFLLKGMAMIFSSYHDFGMRVMGDIDLLIEKRHVPLVHDFLVEQGWSYDLPRFDPRNEEHLMRYHALNFSHADGGRLDIHWSFIQEHSQVLDQAVFEQGVALSIPGLYVPLPSDLLLQALIHGVKHSAVPLIRWIPDALSLLKGASIDWERFCRLALQIRIVQPIVLGLQYLVDYFQAPIPSFVLQRLQASPCLRVERLEAWFHLKGYPKAGDWCRFCINRGHLSLFSQILHLPRYWQITARLPSLWYIPLFAPYWVAKRLKKKLLRRSPDFSQKI